MARREAFLERTIQETGETPKYLISHKGVQFRCEYYKAWCRSRGIDPRFGAVGQHGSVAVVERFIGTLKDGGTRQIVVPPVERRCTSSTRAPVSS